MLLLQKQVLQHPQSQPALLDNESVSARCLADVFREPGRGPAANILQKELS